MPALEVDLHLHENGKLEKTFKCFDEDGAAIDTSSYGAKMEIREGPDEPIILSLSDGAGTITVGGGTDSNEVALALNQPSIIAKKAQLRDANELFYDLVIYPDSSDEDDQPVVIALGRIIYHQWITQLDA